MGKTGTYIHLFLIVLVGFFVYSGALDAPFQFDDTIYIVENPLIKDFEHFKEPSSLDGDATKGINHLLFFRHLNFKLRYMGYLSFALNYMVGGLDVRGYHIVNLIVHLANALLVYVLVRLVLGDFRLMAHSGTIALFSAVLFVTHPIQTQAVTYITQRFASLVVLFYLSSLLLYITARKRGSTILYFLSLISAVLAMKTKETAFTLPLVVALYEVTFFKGAVKRRLMRLLPYFGTMIIIPLTIMQAKRPVSEAITGLASTQAGMSGYEYLLTQFRVLVTYMRLLLFPINQNIDYDYPVYNSFFETPVIISFLILLCVFSLGVYFFRRSRANGDASRILAFGIFWFFITLSVESSVVALADVISEHRLYLPSVGFFIFVVPAAFLFNDKRFKTAVVSGLVMLSLVSTGIAYQRNRVWCCSMTLWEDAVKKSPLKRRPRNNLGMAYFSEGRLGRAKEQLYKALELDPFYATAHTNLAVIYSSLGQKVQSKKHLKTALKLNPGNGITNFNMGCICKSEGLIDEGIAYYQAALRANPEHAAAHNNLANAYVAKGLNEKAITHYRAAMNANPGLAVAHENLVMILERLKQSDKACPICGMPLLIYEGRSMCRCELPLHEASR
jgi:Tfp pilus assembly protein PilF